MLHKMERILWVDAVSDDGWSYEIIKPCTIESVGFVIHEDDDFINLATSVAQDQHGGQWVIPKSIIKRRDVLVLEAAV